MAISDYEEENEQAKFNAGLDTLKRLSEILTDYRKVSSNPLIPTEVRQESRISLLKQFFIQASPLLPVDYVNNNKIEILNIKPHMILVHEKHTFNFKENRQQYNFDLDTQLDIFFVDIQMKLQEQGYFMPSSEDGEMF